MFDALEAQYDDAAPKSNIKGKQARGKRVFRTAYKYYFKHAVVKHYDKFGMDAAGERFFADDKRESARSFPSFGNFCILFVKCNHV